MMQIGCIAIEYLDDGAGGLAAHVTFSPLGGGDDVQLWGPAVVAAGEVLTIAPTCLECDLVTTVSLGPAGQPAPTPGGPQGAGPSATGHGKPARVAGAPARPPQPPRPGGAK